MYIAHKTETGKEQSVKTHSENTALLCQGFALSPWKSLLRIIGLAHDLGKYQKRFQRRINNEKIFAPHAFSGAQEIRKLYGGSMPAMLMQYVIAGHHAGLPDCGTKADSSEVSSLYGMLKRDSENIETYKSEIALDTFDECGLQSYMLEDCKNSLEAAERFAFFTRYCFSCLTDADWLDTEEFFGGEKRQGLSADFQKCLDAVNAALDGFKCDTDLQRKRAQLQAQVFSHIGDGGNIFLMNMPTGSGKTLASIKFALERAIGQDKKGIKRIIYIIPYNSIIDQTAANFEKLFGDCAAILRHQSSFDLESQCEEGQDPLLMKKAAENWDAQIILTTAVQFFESVYSNKRSKLRKLHNMADSILIFDEAHLMPLNFLQPCLQAITHITKYLNSEAVLLTATMPNYHQLFSQLTEREVKIVELVEDRKDFDAFNKCSIRWLGTISNEMLSDRCITSPSCLVVVNKRSISSSTMSEPESSRDT